MYEIYEYDEDNLEVTESSDPSIEINNALKQINVSGEILNYEVISIFHHINIEDLTEDDRFNADYYIGDNAVNFEATIRYLYDDEDNYDKVTGRCIVITKISCGCESKELDIEI